ncbi:MAG TPA: ABC transporter permease [Chloroflexi bacterium]|nr:ABC transporter permease [Chloroflexota bacterium]
MLYLITRRIAAALVTLFLISIVAFIIIQLPPGDFVDAYAGKKTQGGVIITQDELDVMRIRLGIDKPLYQQYLKWIGGVIRGDLGFSWEYHRPVADVIGERLPLTLLLAFATLAFTYMVAIPIGIYSAVRQYSIGDNIATILGYIGLATPGFLFALILMYLGQKWFGMSVGGLFSPEFEDVAWSWAKFADMLSHLWVPVVVLGMAGTAFQLRTIRATLLDELNKMYVTAARAGGVPEFNLLIKYPVRMALNPIVATLGWELSKIISGAPIIGIVLSLPTIGPLYVNALLNQDMYLAGALILIYCILVVVGTFISDILLMILDPRIRLGGKG